MDARAEVHLFTSAVPARPDPSTNSTNYGSMLPGDTKPEDYTDKQMRWIRIWNAIAAGFHGVQFLLMIITSFAVRPPHPLAVRYRSPPSSIAAHYRAREVEQFREFQLPIAVTYLTAEQRPGVTPDPSGDDIVLTAKFEILDSTVRFGPAIAFFFLLSCLAHVVVILPYVNGIYVRGLNKGRNYFRWIEYSLSSTLMIWLIAMLFGIYDIGALLLISICNASMNLCGLLMEQNNQVRNRNTTVNWTSFAIGCLNGAGPWIACFISLGASRANGGEFPGFVWGILFSYLIFFNLFPINMVLQYTRKIDYLTGEKIYIILSFVAKTLLCWLVFSGANQPNKYVD
eukprot:gene11390-2074_t